MWFLLNFFPKLYFFFNFIQKVQFINFISLIFIYFSRKFFWTGKLLKIIFHIFSPIFRSVSFNVQPTTKSDNFYEWAIYFSECKKRKKLCVRIIFWSCAISAICWCFKVKYIVVDHKLCEVRVGALIFLVFFFDVCKYFCFHFPTFMSQPEKILFHYLKCFSQAIEKGKNKKRKASGLMPI